MCSSAVNVEKLVSVIVDLKNNLRKEIESRRSLEIQFDELRQRVEVETAGRKRNDMKYASLTTRFQEFEAGWDRITKDMSSAAKPADLEVLRVELQRVSQQNGRLDSAIQEHHSTLANVRCGVYAIRRFEEDV